MKTKLFVKQVTIVNGNIRYQVMKTLNLPLSVDLRIGHKLTQAEVLGLNELWEVEVS